MTRMMIVLVLAMAAAPSVAKGHPGGDPRLQSVLACEAIIANDARLKCFDQSLAGLREAMSSGQVVVKAASGPTALSGSVARSGRSGENRFWVVLDNGDRWLLLPKTQRRAAPAPGTALTMKKTLWGAYWVSGRGWSESEGEFASRGN